MSQKKMTQWDYAKMLLPYDRGMTEDRLITMPRGALSIWIERTKVKRKEAQREENEELTQAYQELIEEQKPNLLAIAESMTTLEKKGLNEWKGPCPMCRGDDRFSVNTRGVPWWYCRHCCDGGDTVALVAQKNGLTMWEAVEELAGYSPRDRAEVRRERTYSVITPEKKSQSQEWPDFSRKFGACRQIFRENSLSGLAYFARRGLDSETALKNRVGMIQTIRGLAIAYPCERLVDGRWQLVGINRRYLDAKQIKERVGRANIKEAKRIRRDNPKTKVVGKWGAYRLRRVRDARALLIVEGEENSLSVWQAVRAARWFCDVASVGSQSNFKSLKADIMALADDYQRLLIWADEQCIADKAIDLYAHASALAISSPALTGYDKPADANDMLVKGELSEFLAYQLTRLSADLLATPMPTNGTMPTMPTMPTNDHAPMPKGDTIGNTGHTRTNGTGNGTTTPTMRTDGTDGNTGHTPMPTNTPAMLTTPTMPTTPTNDHAPAMPKGDTIGNTGHTRTDGNTGHTVAHYVATMSQPQKAARQPQKATRQSQKPTRPQPQKPEENDVIWDHATGRPVDDDNF